MAKTENRITPEELLQRITAETINALALGTADKIGDAAPLEAGAALIAKAWNLPQESWQASADLIQKEKDLVRSGSSESALPDSEMLEPYDGKMIVELLWGLFETVVRLEEAQDRTAIYDLARHMAESLNHDSWIAEYGPETAGK